MTRAMVAADERAYRQFQDAYFSRLARYLIVVTRGDEHRMRDALQETFRRVAKHIRVFDREDVFWSWLTTLARSAAIDQQRSAQRYWTILDRFRRDPAHAPAPIDRESQKLHEMIEAEVQKLHPADRRLIEAKYFDRLSTREIAESANTTEGAVESRLVRARQKLKAALISALNHGSTE